MPGSLHGLVSGRRTSLLAGACLFLSACSDEGLRYETGSDTTDRLLALSRQGPRGTTHALRDHARFDWDEVFHFPSGTLHGDMEEAVGAPVLDDPDGRYIGIGPLLVFVENGVPVRALAVVPPLFVGGGSRRGHSRETATLIAHTKDPGPYLLTFVD